MTASPRPLCPTRPASAGPRHERVRLSFRASGRHGSGRAARRPSGEASTGGSSSRPASASRTRRSPISSSRAGSTSRSSTLDTGRLFPSTYKVWEETEAPLRRPHPLLPPRRQAALAAYRRRRRASTASTDRRRRGSAAARVRKVEPLGRALAGAAAWVTGLRADQSAGRAPCRARRLGRRSAR